MHNAGRPAAGGGSRKKSGETGNKGLDAAARIRYKGTRPTYIKHRRRFLESAAVILRYLNPGAGPGQGLRDPAGIRSLVAAAGEGNPAKPGGGAAGFSRT